MTERSEPSPGAEADAPLGPARRAPRPPSLLDAVAPVVVLIALLALTIALFGIDATNGPLQVALLLSAAFASLIAFKNGYTVATIRDATVGGVTTAMGAIFILLAVGALIGTWNMAGTIPTVVDYGIRLLSPTWFYVTTAAICAVVGMVIFVVLGLNAEPEGAVGTEAAQEALNTGFNISAVNPLPWGCWRYLPSARPRRSWPSWDRRCPPRSWPPSPSRRPSPPSSTSPSWDRSRPPSRPTSPPWPPAS
jgi:hypothetical protein